jgi:hypothetical protein
VSAAQALRKAQLGSLYPLTTATPYRDTLFAGQLSARYDVSDAFTAFVTLAYGEKPGRPRSTACFLRPVHRSPRPVRANGQCSRSARWMVNWASGPALPMASWW